MKKERMGKREGKANEKAWELRVTTDLALEAAEGLSGEAGPDGFAFDGVKIESEEKTVDDATIKTSWIQITNAAGEKEMGKPQGNYISIESAAMKENNQTVHESIIQVLSSKFVQLCQLKPDDLILVVGLGNWHVTPDALGPKVVSKILVTSHMLDEVPEPINGTVRSVSAVTPGVMGITGIETGEIVRGIVERVHPDLVIAVDALAARHSSRVNATIQFTDTGIHPGAGMGNRRMAINEETLGVPVIAVGVPTVVDAATLVNDSLDAMLSALMTVLPEGSPFYDMLNKLESEEKYQLIKSALDPYTGNMFVAPKEVDAVIERLSNIIANAINIALHPGITQEDINRYLY